MELGRKGDLVAKTPFLTFPPSLGGRTVGDHFVLFASEMCVCDIAGLLGMTVSAISHQLRVLKAADLVRSRRDGKTVFYALADDHVRTIIGQGMDHVNE